MPVGGGRYGVEGMNGSHFHVLPVPDLPPTEAASSALTPRLETALAGGVTQTYWLTHQPLAKTKHPDSFRWA